MPWMLKVLKQTSRSAEQKEEDIPIDTTSHFSSLSIGH